MRVKLKTSINSKASKEVQQKEIKNSLIFKKSFYGMNTPDRQITPDDDERFKTCLVCNGKGHIIVWSQDEDEETPDYENCEACEGEGKIEVDDWEDEW